MQGSGGAAAAGGPGHSEGATRSLRSSSSAVGGQRNSLQSSKSMRKSTMESLMADLGGKGGDRQPSRLTFASLPPGQQRGSGTGSTTPLVERRGSVLSSVLEKAGGGSGRPEDGAGSAGEMHPGLARLNTMMRRKSSIMRKSAFKGAAEGIDELAAAMDSVDARLLGAVNELRGQNTAVVGVLGVPSRAPSGKAAPEELTWPGSNCGTAGGRPNSPQKPRGARVARQVEGDEEEAAPELIAAHPGTQPQKQELPFDRWRAAPQAGAAEEAAAAAVAAAAPAQQDAAAMAAPAAADTMGMLNAAAARQGRGGREEVAALRAWLQEMMSPLGSPPAVAAGEPSVAGGGAACPPEQPGGRRPGKLADTALYVYGAAFGELQKQVAAESSDRAELLGALWTHCFNLVSAAGCS